MLVTEENSHGSLLVYPEVGGGGVLVDLQLVCIYNGLLTITK